MTTTSDKIQVGDINIGGGTATTSTSLNYIPKHVTEKGWECPRCGRINAPWVRQCDCNGNNWTITSDWTYKPEWWKEITCSPDTFRIHPESDPIWKAPSSTCGSDSSTCKSDSITTAWNANSAMVAGGSDYWNPLTKAWENVSTNISNLQKEINDLKLNYKIEEIK